MTSCLTKNSHFLEHKQPMSLFSSCLFSIFPFLCSSAITWHWHSKNGKFIVIRDIYFLTMRHDNFSLNVGWSRNLLWLWNEMKISVHIDCALLISQFFYYTVALGSPQFLTCQSLLTCQGVCALSLGVISCSAFSKSASWRPYPKPACCLPHLQWT